MLYNSKDLVKIGPMKEGILAGKRSVPERGGGVSGLEGCASTIRKLCLYEGYPEGRL